MKSLLIAAALTAAVTGAAAFADDASLYKVSDATVLTDFANDVPKDQRNASVTIVLPDAARKNVALVATLEMRDGKWMEPVVKEGKTTNPHAGGVSGLFSPLQVGWGPPAPPQKGEADPSGLTLDEKGLRGKVVIKLHPMGWGPKDKQGNQKQVYEEAVYEATLDLKRTGKNVPLMDPDPSTPIWRKNNTRPTGHELAGTFEVKQTAGKAGGGVEKGAGIGGVSVVPVKGTFGTQGNAIISPAEGGGLHFHAHLGDKRVSGSAAYASAVKAFNEPLKLGKYDGLRVTLASDKRRDDITVGVALQEGTGAWYQNDNAGFLAGKEATFIVPFDDLRHAGGFDDDSWLNIDAVKAIRITVNNPMGVGEVDFTVKKIEAVRWTDAGWGKAPEGPVTVTVDGSTAISHEGTREIPKGLFGFHDVSAPKAPATPEEAKKILDYTAQIRPGHFRRIEHVGFSAKPITDEEIKARQEARKAAGTEQVSFDRQRIAAADAADEVMVCHTTNLWAAPPWMSHYAKGTMDEFLNGVEAFYRNQGANAWVKGDDANAVRLIEVWNEPFMWARHMNKHDPKFQDPTQFSDNPAKLVTDVYSQIYKAAVQGFRSANADTKLGGPCTASLNEDHFANIQYFVGPFVDQCHDQIDFLTEHHYQGHPASFAAGYDVMTAYTDTRHGKRFPIYNTETNDLIDTPNKGDKVEDRPFDEHSDQMNRAYYNAKDIITMAREIPDIAKGRAMHALWSGFCRNQGETDVYTLLAGLRGTTLQTSADAADALTFATRNGERTVVFVLNDSRFERTFRLKAGDVAGKKASVQTLTYDKGTQLKTVDVTWRDGVAEVTLPKRGMAVWTIDAAAPVRHSMEHRRYYANAVLTEVRPGHDKTVTVGLPPETLEQASGAYLRLVTSDVQAGEGFATINGVRVALPKSVANEGAVEVQHVPLDVKSLKPGTAITFTTDRPEVHNGYELHSASIVLVQREPQP